MTCLNDLRSSYSNQVWNIVKHRQPEFPWPVYLTSIKESKGIVPRGPAYKKLIWREYAAPFLKNVIAPALEAYIEQCTDEVD